MKQEEAAPEKMKRDQGEIVYLQKDNHAPYVKVSAHKKIKDMAIQRPRLTQFTSYDKDEATHYQGMEEEMMLH